VLFAVAVLLGLLLIVQQPSESEAPTAPSVQKVAVVPNRTTHVGTADNTTKDAPSSEMSEQTQAPPKEEDTASQTEEDHTVVTIGTPVVEQTPPAPPSEPTAVAQSLAPPPTDFSTEKVLPALVNILCLSSGPFSGVTGSGIVIDPRGIVLTNAHVAQYILLQDFPNENTFNCTVRTGGPARERYIAELLFLPAKWAEEHAASIRDEIQTGTGEHDWALLYITERTDGSPLQNSFPYVPFDTGEAIVQKGDSVLLSGYPAGFLGGITIRKDLWPASTVVQIADLFTFKEGTVDILSFGGTILAQSGSSGGAVVNADDNLIGIVVTSSEGETTAERDLRAVTLSHINASMFAHTDQALSQFLQNDPAQLAAVFGETLAPMLKAYFADVLNN
jgi:S1-C subfamily serine protease